MNLTVKLFATFQKGRFVKEQREYPPGTSIRQIAEGLQLPVDEIGVMMVNGRHAELEHQPAPGDTVAIFPQIGGG
jgi:molybdopterin converting factor small subunit